MSESHQNEARGVEPARHRLPPRIPDTRYSGPAINRRIEPHMSRAMMRAAFPVASPVR